MGFQSSIGPQNIENSSVCRKLILKNCQRMWCPRPKRVSNLDSESDFLTAFQVLINYTICVFCMSNPNTFAA